MAYHDRVIGRMVSPLWFQLGTNVPSATGAGGGVSPETPPTVFGVPEHVPELTYVSTSGTAGFLNDAVAYHAIYGLNGAGLTQPGRIDSLEDLIDKLRPDSSHIGRLRVVSHVGLNTTTIEANMNLPFFNGGPAFIWRQLLEGFAIDDVTGLRAIIDPSNFQHPSAPFFNSLVSESIDILRIIDPDVLAPFSLESSGSPSGDLELFFFACSDKLFAALAERDTDYCELTFNGSALNNTERNNLNNSLDIIANALKDRISGGSSTMNTNLENLRAAIASLNFFLLMARLPNFVNLVSPILDALRDDVATQPLLVPFGLGDSGSPTPGSDQAFFFNICSDLLYVHLVRGNPSLGTIDLGGTALSPQQNHDLDAALDRIFEAIKQRLMHGTFTEQQLTDLHDAILRLDMGTLHLSSSLGTSPSYGNFGSRYYRGTPLFTVTDAVGAQITALNSHTIPAGLREAFTEHSIDISGATVTQLDADNGWLLRKGSNEYFVRSDDAGTTLYIHSKTPNPFAMLGQANTAIGNNFRAHLDTVRARFDEHSWVDIRGCRIGQDRDYLVALRNFFGNSTHLPSVSGPMWYQSFPSAGYVGRTTELQIDNLWNHGFSSAAPPINHTAAEIQNTFNGTGNKNRDSIPDLTGIDIHVNFWEQLTNGETFAFVALVWKGRLPQLPIEAPRLDGFLALDLSDTMTRLSQIFDVSAPAPATFTRIEAKHAQMAALQTEIDTIADLSSQASPPAADLTASFNRLHTISQQLSLTTVPATPPASLQVSHLQTYSHQLKRYFEIVTIPNGPANLYQAYMQIEALAAQASPPATDLRARFLELQQIQTNIVEPASGTDEERRDYAVRLQGYVVQLTNHLNSAADMVTFKQSVHSKTQHAKAAFRYYFFIGMPLLIDQYNNECYYFLDVALNPSTHLRDAAIRSFMRAQWQEPLPSGNNVGSATMAQNAARRISVLSEYEPHGPDPQYGRTDLDYVNPYPEFDEHIKKVP